MPLHDTPSVDLQVNEQASDLLNNWLEELDLDKIVQAKVGELSSNANKSKTKQGSSESESNSQKNEKQQSIRTEKCTPKTDSKANSISELKGKAKDSTKKNEKFPLKSKGKPLPVKSTVQATVSKKVATIIPQPNKIPTEDIQLNEKEYQVSELLERNNLLENDLDFQENLFLPQSNSDLEMLQILETNRQLKALTDFSTTNQLNSKYIWRSAHTGSESPKLPPKKSITKEKRKNTNVNTSFEDSSSKSTKSDLNSVRLKSSFIGRRHVTKKQAGINPSQMVLTGKMLFDTQSPKQAISPTAKKSDTKSKNHDKSLSHSKILCSPTVLSRSLRQQAEKDKKELFMNQKLNPSLYVNNEAAIPLSRPNSASGSRSRTTNKSTSRSNEGWIMPKNVTKKQLATKVTREIDIRSSAVSIDTVDDPEVQRIMNMDISSEMEEYDFEDEQKVEPFEFSQTYDDSNWNRGSPTGHTSSHSLPGKLQPNPIDMEAYLRQNVLYAEKAMRKDREWDEKQRRIQEREEELATLDSDLSLVNRQLFNPNDFLSPDNPYLNPNEKSRKANLVASPSSSKKYQRTDHPEITRQKVLYKNLYETQPQDTEIESEIEKKLVTMHEQLKKERDERERVTEMLKRMELEKKKDELEKIRIEKQQLIEEQNKKRKQISQMKCNAFVATMDLRLKRKAFLLWQSKYLPFIKRMREIEYKLTWKRKSRIFFAWRHFVKQQKEIQFEQVLQRRLIMEQKREEAADNFYKMRILTQCFIHLQFMFKLSKQRKEIMKSSKLRQEKMSSLLQRLHETAHHEVDPDSTQFLDHQDRSTRIISSQKNSPSRVGITPTKQNRTQFVPELSSQIERANGSESQNNEGQISRIAVQIDKNAIDNHDNEIESTISSKTHVHPFMNMLERQKARMESRRALQEKYKKADEEKEKQRLDEQRRLELEKKEQKRLALLEKKREKELKLQKEKEREQRKADYRQKKEIADLHHIKSCLRFGLLSWKRFIQQRKDMLSKADDHYNATLKKSYFLGLHAIYKMQLEEKEIQRELGLEKLKQTFKTVLLYNCFQKLKAEFNTIQKEYQQIDTIYERHLMTNTFRHWFFAYQGHQTVRLEHEKIQSEIATRHACKYIKRKYWQSWKKYIQICKEERIEKALESQLRNKVESWLTDFRVNSELDWDL